MTLLLYIVMGVSFNNEGVAGGDSAHNASPNIGHSFVSYFTMAEHALTCLISRLYWIGCPKKQFVSITC